MAVIYLEACIISNYLVDQLCVYLVCPSARYVFSSLS
jgi:hypothetical protein